MNRTKPAPRITFYELIIILVTLSFLVALSLNLSPDLRGPAEWRWAYALPGRPERLCIPVLVLILYLGLASYWIKRATPGEVHEAETAPARWPTVALLVTSLIAVPAIQASLLAVEHSDILQQLFYRTVSPGASGVFSVGSTIENVGDFLRRYPTLMPTFPIHPQRYPPGLPVLFYLARRLLEKTPALADTLGFHLRLYQCHDLALMRLSNATIASAVLQMHVPLISGVTVLPLYGLARRAYGHRIAAWAAALYPLVPSFALWAGRWEQFYPLLACASGYWFYVGLTGSRRPALLAAGFTLSLASMLNFGNLALLLPLGSFALLWALARHEHHRQRWMRLAADGLVFLAGLASPWIAYQVAFGSGFLDVWRVSMSYHLGLDRSYWTWLGYHLYDFFAFLGVPLTLEFLVALIRATGDLRGRRYDTLVLGIALGLLLLDLSGTSRGEVARVWLFLTPLAVLVAARGWARLSLGQRGFTVTAILLALQLLVFNTFLRVVTTGLAQPPSHDPVFDPPPVTHPLEARLGDEVALVGYDLEPANPLAGDTLHLTLHWRSLRPMRQPYTVFTHLVGPDNRLAGQQDHMPVWNTLPTTCWVPGEFIADPYNITIVAETSPGDYTLETGFYVLETGERLPTSGPAAVPDGRVRLTTIRVGAGRDSAGEHTRLRSE